jgi:hypothetical protein
VQDDLLWENNKTILSLWGKVSNETIPCIIFQNFRSLFLCGEKKLRDHKLINEGCGEPKDCFSLMWESYVRKFNQFHFSKSVGFNMSLWWFDFDFWCKNKFWWPLNPCVFFHGDLGINPTFVSAKHEVPMLSPLDFITNNYITIIWILEKILLHTLYSHSMLHCITNMVQMII